MTRMISVASGFQSSVNISYDLNDDSKLKKYIPTKSSLGLLQDILLSTRGDSVDRSRILIGPYGKGKSHIVLMIMSILMKKDLALFEKMMPVIKMDNEELYHLIKNYYTGNIKLLPVVISGTSNSISQAFMLALQQTLGEYELNDIMPETSYKAALRVIDRWKDEFPETYAAFKEKINEPIEVFVENLEDYDPARYEINERDILLSQQVDRISVLLSRWFGNSAGTDDSYSEFGIVSDQSGANSGPLEPSLLNGWGSAAGPMDLTRSFDFAALDDPVLSARADTDGTVYLRMSSYGDYSGTAWQIADDPPTASSLPLTALAIEDQSDTQRHSMILQVKTTLPYSCVPYYCLREDASDSFLMEDGPGQQKVLYFSYPGDLMHLAVPGEYESRERDYRAFAHQYYTRLPDETASVMRQLSSAAGLDASDPDIVQTVAKYVQNAGTYDLLTEPYPSNDYAVWFLTEAHRGYCIHFATAAAVLYRSLGIPARVTLGYLLDARSDAEVEVSAADAHAWVEVYADGLGWLPVEVTGQNDARDHSSDNAGEMGLEKTEAPGDMASDAPGEGSDAPTAETAGGNETETPGSEQLPVGIVPGANTSDGKQNKDNKTARNRILLLLIPILLVSILPLWRLTARAILKRAYHQEDRRKAAVAVYRSAIYIRKLGASIPEQIEITAEKARFSNHEITEEEINENLILLEDAIHSLYSQLKPLNKLHLKYWKGLL